MELFICSWYVLKNYQMFSKHVMMNKIVIPQIPFLKIPMLFGIGVPSYAMRLTANLAKIGIVAVGIFQRNWVEVAEADVRY
ncbi:MAG: hypothetical protein GY748_20465 [Planctomycetaceae bacterium]|nr:hypothetical protein [Planctomycetaceae bacterium]